MRVFTRGQSVSILYASSSLLLTPTASIYTAAGALVTSTSLTLSGTVYVASWSTAAVDIGDYFIVIVPTPEAPTVEAVRVERNARSERDASSVEASFSYLAATSQLRALVWAPAAAVGSVSNATCTLYAADGTLLVATATVAAPDTRGVFAFLLTAPSFVLGENAAYAVVTIAHSEPPAAVLTSVADVVFVRSS